MSSSDRRTDILSRVQSIQESTTKPSDDDGQLDRELADLHDTLPTTWLTNDMYSTGEPHRGYLYNVGTGTYVAVDSNNKWLLASAPDSKAAVLFNMQRASGNLFLTADVRGKPMYFNWRNSSQACKLYGSYDAIETRNFEDIKFHIEGKRGRVGTFYRDNPQLYIAVSGSNKEFQFQIFNQAAFSPDDELIYSTFIKEYSSIS